MLLKIFNWVKREWSTHALDLILKLGDTVHVREFLQHGAAGGAGSLCGRILVVGLTAWIVMLTHHT